MDTDDGAGPAIERVRRELALLGRDEASAPELPAEVQARIGTALRSAPPPAHALSRPRLGRRRLLGLLTGLTAVLLGAVVGTSMLLQQPPPSRFARGPTAHSITVPRPAAAFPLTEADLVALLSAPPEYGPLSDRDQRDACLSGLGYPPATPVLGARALTGAPTTGVVLLVAGDSPTLLTALLVAPNCGAGHSGSLADTVVRRP